MTCAPFAEPLAWAPVKSGLGDTLVVTVLDETAASVPNLICAVFEIWQVWLLVTLTVNVTEPEPVFGARGPTVQLAEETTTPVVVQPPVQPVNAVPDGIASVMVAVGASAGPVLV